MLDRLTTRIRRAVWRQEAAAPVVEKAPLEPQHIGRARLILHAAETEVLLSADFCEAPWLRLVGALAGTPSTVQTQVGTRPATLITFPLGLPGREERIQVTAAHTGPVLPSPAFQLVRASHRSIPEGHSVEVVFADPDSESQIRYLVEMPLEAEVVGFSDFAQASPVFEEIPPVTQMVAFLKATIHQRRTTLRSLSTMARRTRDPRILAMVQAMEAALSGGHDFSNPGIELARHVLEAHGRTVYPNTVAALCLLADIFLGNLTPEHLEKLEKEGMPLATSPEAARAVVEFLGVKGSSKVWRDLRPEGLGAPRWKASRQLADFLNENLGKRTALSVLQDLSDDSGSERSRNRVARLLAKVPADQVLVNDEHEALRSYLEARDRRIQAETIAAIGIYVDFEAGALAEEDIDSLTPHRSFWDTSLYGMLAIAGAFDRELRAFHVTQQRWKALSALAGLAEGGVVARFLEKGQHGYTSCHLRDPHEVEQARRRGLRFTGEVLGCLPSLEQLDEPDLVELTSDGTEVLACFASADKSLQWRRISGPIPRPEAAQELLKGDFSYIDGYRVYNFKQNVVGRLVEADGENWRGGVAVYKDQRGNHHLKRLARLGDPPEHGWEWASLRVEFPELRGLPRILPEMSTDALLGRPAKRTQEQSRLDWVLTGVRELLDEPWRYRALADYPSQCASLEEALGASALNTVLVGLVEDRPALLARLSRSEPSFRQLQVCEPLLQALSLPEAHEFAALALLYEVMDNPGVRFRDLLMDRLVAMVEADEPAVRTLACQLLGSSLPAGDQQRQLAVRYLLHRCVEQDRATVAASAARSLAALALAPMVPLADLALLEEEESGQARYLTLSEEALTQLYRSLVATWQAFAQSFELPLPVLLRSRRPRELLRSYHQALPELLRKTEAASPTVQATELTSKPPKSAPGQRVLRWTGTQPPLEAQDLQVLEGGEYRPLIDPELGPPEHRAELEALRSMGPQEEAALDYAQLSRELVTFFDLTPDYVEPVRTLLMGATANEEEAEAAPEEPALSPLETQLQTVHRQLYAAEQKAAALAGQVIDDPVTGLPGPLAVELSLRYAPRGVLIFRLSGEDASLRSWTQALKEQVSLLGRTGPDEFVALVSVGSALELANRASALRQATGMPLVFGASLGSLEEAREGLARARESGVELHFEDAAAQREYEQGSGLEYELWRALDNQEFALHWQPVLNLFSMRPVGCEGLLRWQHPERGLLEPAAFLEGARRAGVLAALTPWLEEQAHTVARRWPELWFSLNQGPLNGGLVQELLPGDPLGEGRLAYDRLGSAAWPLDALRPGSLAKIGVNDLQLTFGAVSLARALRLEPVAVGVETETQLQFLRGIGCELAQGFLLARPVAREGLGQALL